MNKKNFLGRSLALLAALALTACAEGPGGGGIGGTGKAAGPDTLIVGVVDGFGSVILNDQRFETDSATVFVDGNAAQLADLSIGMTVVARIVSADREALQLRYQPDITGTVTFVESDLSRLKVLGQTVYLNDATLFDGMAVSEIVPGISVEISGNRNADNEIVAGYVRRPADATRAFIVGRVENSAERGRATIGSALIDASGLAAELGISEEEYQDTYMEHGALVRLEATISDTNGNGDQQVLLTAIDISPVTQPPYNAGDSVQVQGVVGADIGNGTYRISDVTAMVNSDTRAVTSFGLPMAFPEDPRNRPVLLDGVAQTANGTVVIEQIQFLDEM